VVVHKLMLTMVMKRWKGMPSSFRYCVCSNMHVIYIRQTYNLALIRTKLEININFQFGFSSLNAYILWSLLHIAYRLFTVDWKNAWTKKFKKKKKKKIFNEVQKWNGLNCWCTKMIQKHQTTAICTSIFPRPRINIDKN